MKVSGATLSAMLLAAVLGSVAGYVTWRAVLGEPGRAVPFVRLLPAEPPAPPAELIGQVAPPFTLPDMDGTTRSLADWHGQVVLINFWATWCGPCREEMPMLVELRAHYRARGFEVVGVAVDDPVEIAKFTGEFGVDFPIVYGDADALRLSQHFGNRIGALPYSALVDRRGRIAWLKAGLLDRSGLEAALQPLL